MGKASQEIGGALQTGGKQTCGSYSIQGVNTRRPELSTLKIADKLLMRANGQRISKTWLSGMQLSLDSKIQWCIRSVRKRTKIPH